MGRRGAKQQGSREHGLRVRTASRIPPAQDILPVTIEHTRANLQHQVGPSMAPAHLLFLPHAPAHHLVRRRFHKPRADPLTVAVALAIVGNECLIALDGGVSHVDTDETLLEIV